MLTRKTSFALLAILSVAGCGGSDGGDEGIQARRLSAVARSSTTGNSATATPEESIKGFSYSRGGPAFVLDWEGTWLPLEANEVGFTGARRVKNLFLNSDNAAAWLLLADGQSSYAAVNSTIPGGLPGVVLQISHAAGQNGSPYICNYLSGSEPGLQPPSLFASRLWFRQTAGDFPQVFSPVGRTMGTAIGSESNNPRVTAPDGRWILASQTAQQFEQHLGYGQTLLTPTSKLAKTYEVAAVQFEDLSGAKKPISSEYVPSTARPGVQWFGTEAANTRTGVPIYGTYNAINDAISTGGILTERTGAALDVKGYASEASATNLALWSTNDHVGTAVLDAASANYTFVAPAAAGSKDIYLDPRSGRFAYSRTDLALGQTDGVDQINSTSTDLAALGFRANQSIWVYVAESSAGAGNGGIYGPMKVAEVTARRIRMIGTAQLPTLGPGRRVNVHRVPDVGDDIIVARNDGTHHRSTVASVTLPALTPTATADSYQHMSVRVTLADAMPADGIHGAIAGKNNNLPVYYYAKQDLGVTIAAGTNATARLVPDDSAVIAAGLGYLLRHRLVLELNGGTGANALFDLPAAAGTYNRPTAVSAYARRTAGSKTYAILLQSHTGAVGMTNTTYQRVVSTTTSVSTTGRARFLVPPNNTIRVAMPQVEQLAAGATAVATSPIATTSVAATRAATLATAPWTAAYTNDFEVALDWTPGSGAVAQRQSLWSVHVDPNNYVEVFAQGSQVGVKKRVAGVDAISVVDTAPVAGLTYRVIATLSSTVGVGVSVNGVAGPPSPNRAPVPLGPLSTQQMGSLMGTNVSNGAIRNLSITSMAGRT